MGSYATRIAVRNLFDDAIETKIDYQMTTQLVVLKMPLLV